MSFITEDVDKKEHKYNLCLAFVVDIISNWEKHPYNPKHSLKNSIENKSKIHMNIFHGIISSTTSNLFISLIEMEMATIHISQW